ncbi:hypothetical protein QYF61_021679 [Mycteria americana]|uniref:Reverse transcriptase domain-containing protein n=1 Tax=Mycteria americana TaxID=33587 RepID=A0AAN7S9L2_MYCAM|nr:hypothetical protein QYF61_021679 [Mycteria americana]
MAETKCYELTTTPMSHPPALLRGGKRDGSDVEPGKKRAVRSEEKSVRNNPVDTKVREEGEEVRQAPEQIPVQPVDRTTLEPISTLQPMEDLMLQQVDLQKEDASLQVSGRKECLEPLSESRADGLLACSKCAVFNELCCRVKELWEEVIRLHSISKVSLYFSKAFDTVCHNILIEKLTNGVPQSSVLVLILCNYFISDMNAVTNVADDTVLEGVTDKPDGCATIQTDLNRLENLPGRYLKKSLSKGNAKSCTSEGITTHTNTCLGPAIWNIALQKRTWGVNSILGYIRKSIVSRSREVILPLFSAIVQERYAATRVSLLGAAKIIKELEHLSCEGEKVRAGTFQPGEQRLGSILPMCINA